MEKTILMDSTDSKRYFPLFFSFSTKFLLIHKAGNIWSCCLPCGFLSGSGFNVLLSVDKNPWGKNSPKGFSQLKEKEISMPCYQSIKTPWGKISPKGFSFFPFSFRILIIARWASQGCQGSPLASLAPMNGRLRLPPLTAFAHLANLTIKERKGKRNFTTQQPPARTKIRYLLPVERPQWNYCSIPITTINFFKTTTSKISSIIDNRKTYHILYPLFI